MKNEEKAKMLVDQCQPCSKDFHSGFYQGALIALNAESSEEAKTERNAIVVSSFMEHCKENGIEIPDSLFESYFDA